MKIKSIGSDPEVFISKNEEIVPCVGIFEGGKKQSFVLDEDVSILEDNVSLEWNVSPAYSMEEFVFKSVGAFATVKAYAKSKGYDVEVINFHKFNKNQLMSKQAREFGCDPDFNAYTLRKNTPPKTSTLFRANGGHLHFGLDPAPDSYQMLINFIIMLDATIGTYCVMNEPKSERRLMYGCAGSFREKTYGVEYRTPSNFWVNSVEHMKKIYFLAEASAYMVSNGTIISAGSKEKLMNAINSHDVDTCSSIHKNIINLYGTELPSESKVAVGSFVD